MEPVGLAVGIAGLGGLFTTCLDAVQRIDAYKDFGRDSRSLAARFEADRLRLSKWGDVTGVRTATSDEQNHPALNNPAIRAQVSNIFSIIRDFYNHGDEDGIISLRSDSSTLRDSEEGLRQNKESRRQKLSWALRGKSKQVAQVDQFENLVQKLYELVPIASPLETKSRNDSDKLESWTTEVRGTLERLEKEITAETRRDLHSWLGCGVQEPTYSNFIKKRVSGTCDWIVSHSAFVHWLESSPGGSSKILWVNGPAGFGKTVLCARIVEYLFSTLKTPIAHFFLSGNFDSRDDPYLALRSWISQIITQNTTAYGLVRQIWLEQSIQVASRATILNVFAQVVEAIPDCTLVLDGLDECTWLGKEYPSDDNISVFLRSILSAVENTATKILVVSRDELEIRQGFDEAHNLVELKISPVHVQNDTLLYSQSIVEAKLKKKDSVTKAEISTKLATRCQGQFLWLKLQENSLRTWKNKKQLGEAIEKTPSGLELLYERDWVRMARLPAEEQRRAYSLLRWAVFAHRPLTIAEVVEALLIDPERDSFAIDEMPDSIDEEYIDSEILGLCGSLLEVRHNYMAGSAVDAQTIHLAHFSVKEYFLGHSYVQGIFPQTDDTLQRSNSAFEIGHLAKLCLLYLCFPQSWAEWDEARNKSTQAHETNTVRGSFKRYAALHWFQHASAGLVDDEQLLGLVKRLFDENNPIWHAWRKLWFDATYSLSSENDSYPSTFTPLHFASLFGLKEVVRHYLEHAEYSLNEMCFPGDTPLSLACSGGHVQTVHLLLESKADVEVRIRYSSTPLQVAIENGHGEVANLLINKGANINHSTKTGWTMLHHACENDSLDIAKILINAGANTAAVTEHKWSPLHSAATNGNHDIAKLLLELDKSIIDLPDVRSLTPLNQAAHFGNFDVARLLVKSGANLRIADSIMGLTPLNSASKAGHAEIVRLLLGAGDAGIDIPDNKGYTPLTRSAQSGYTEIAKLLIAHGADIEAANPRGWTPLITALDFGHPEIADMLLNKGSRVDARTKRGKSPLMAAASQGLTNLVEILLARDAAIDDTDLLGFTALMRACNRGHLGVVRVLISQGASLSSLNSNGWDALSIASNNGYTDIVKALIEAGVNLDVVTSNGWSPLSAAAGEGHLETVQTLLDNGASVDFHKDSSWTALMRACGCGHLEIVKLLVKRGADVSHISKDEMTSISIASDSGRPCIVEFLVSQGALVSS